MPISRCGPECSNGFGVWGGKGKRKGEREMMREDHQWYDRQTWKPSRSGNESRMGMDTDRDMDNGNMGTMGIRRWRWR
jgi:hypothetical protein